MAKLRVAMDVYHCDRCNHEWMIRGAHEPITCPKCRTPYWNIPRRVD
jgi:rubrerythrin